MCYIAFIDTKNNYFKPLINAKYDKLTVASVYLLVIFSTLA